MHTAAHVGLNRSVNWLCFPHFDSPSVFCSILDDEKSRRFQISSACEDSVSYNQFYWPDTNVLITRFLSPDGVGEISDFMPEGLSKEDAGYHPFIRSVHVARCASRFSVTLPLIEHVTTNHHHLS